MSTLFENVLLCLKLLSLLFLDYSAGKSILVEDASPTTKVLNMIIRLDP